MSKRLGSSELPVINCFVCGPKRNKHCAKCGGSGSLFWVGGRGFPYTLKGEEEARQWASTNGWGRDDSKRVTVTHDLP